LADVVERFDAIVFCAVEAQPTPDECAKLKPLVEVILAPNDDTGRPPTREELATALRTSEIVADRVRRGKHVLVTCMQGRNRSGLVVALALHRLMGWPGRQCVSHVRARRKDALTNRYFVIALETLARKVV
jgi:protein-tyrosine phosphatase